MAIQNMQTTGATSNSLPKKFLGVPVKNPSPRGETFFDSRRVFAWASWTNLGSDCKDGPDVAALAADPVTLF